MNGFITQMFQNTIVKFPDTQDELKQNIGAVFSMSGTDFSITNSFKTVLIYYGLGHL